MSFVGLYTGLSGIRAAQTGLDTASNNVANANTPGYTRQRVELRASHTYNSPSGPIGTGVTVDAIARLRDTFLDDRFRSAVGSGTEDAVRAEFLASMESLSGEPDLGLGARIGRLWEATEQWANNPNDGATRRQMLTELTAIGEGFRATADSWDSLGTDYGERRGSQIDAANQLLEQLNGFNVRMANAHPDDYGPDLEDQRDRVLDDLAELTGASSRIQADGSVTVTLGSETLLQFADTGAGSGFAQLRVDGDPEQVQASALGDGSAAHDFTGAADITDAVTGEVGGLHRALTEDLPEWRDQLDALATQFAGAINRVNSEGLRADGTPGEALLEFTDATDPAGTIQLVTGVGNDDLAAAQGVVGDPAPAPHDNSNARAFAELRSVRLDATGGADPTNGRSIENTLADQVVGLAGSVRSSQVGAEASAGVASGASLARAAEHGVSIDEEMVGLVRYQRALEASARVMTTVDQALDTLVNRVGIVGR